MPTPQAILGAISGGRVLDVATGNGSFINFLLAGLKDYTEIIGMDANPKHAEAFAEAFQDHPNVHFQELDALHLGLPEESFDTVSISNSLHHFADPAQVLQGMLRLLRPGGTFIAAEMYRDGQTETQRTHVELHHWWGVVDRLAGVVHQPTYCRQELIDLLEPLKLEGLALYDLADLQDDPFEPEMLAQLEAVIDRYIQRAAAQGAEHPELQAEGERLRQRVKTVGFHGATSLIMVGKKPG